MGNTNNHDDYLVIRRAIQSLGYNHDGPDTAHAWFLLQFFLRYLDNDASPKILKPLQILTDNGELITTFNDALTVLSDSYQYRGRDNYGVLLTESLHAESHWFDILQAFDFITTHQIGDQLHTFPTHLGRTAVSYLQS